MSKKYNQKEAAIRALEKYAKENRQNYALHYRKITDLIAKNKYFNFTNKTPTDSISRELTKKSDFWRAKPGYYGLTIWGEDYKIDELTSDEIRNLSNNNIIKKYTEQDVNFVDSSLVNFSEISENKNIEGKKSYMLSDITNEGCFLESADLLKIFSTLENKKNLTLQGPPGTGKTWLAKRLGYALVGTEHSDNLKALQFHPNTSYEDFIRGYRPDGQGSLKLQDGIFLQIVEKALAAPDQEFVLIIEEINRGNPAQIFGEMLTLLENTKRDKKHALELIYKRDESEKIYLPENFYLIGTMNIADRSLAMPDLALRRRFAFVTLEPAFNEKWLNFVSDTATKSFFNKIGAAVKELNAAISQNSNLGKNFCIGHSFFTPKPLPATVEDAKVWLGGVFETEITPLLEEYFFDDLSEARKLLQAFKKQVFSEPNEEKLQSEALQAEPV